MAHIFSSIDKTIRYKDKLFATYVKILIQYFWWSKNINLFVENGLY